MLIRQKICRWILVDPEVSYLILMNLVIGAHNYFHDGLDWIVLVALITLLFVCRRKEAD